MQITKSSLTLVEYDVDKGQYLKIGKGWEVRESERDGREIVAAAVNASQFIVALNGARLILLKLKQDVDEICQHVCVMLLFLILKG